MGLKVCRGRMEKKDVKRREQGWKTKMENVIEVAGTLRARWGIEQAERRKEGEGGCMLCVAHAQHELENARGTRARTNDRGATKTAATVRHEREQGDERVSESAKRRSL